MEAMSFDLRTEANLAALTDEVVTSSAIEGEKLSKDWFASEWSSIARCAMRFGSSESGNEVGDAATRNRGYLQPG